MVTPVIVDPERVDATFDMCLRSKRRKVVRGECVCLYCGKQVSTTDGVVDEHYRSHDEEDENGCLGVGGIQVSFERLTGVVIPTAVIEQVRFSKARPFRVDKPQRKNHFRGAGVCKSGIDKHQAAARRAVLGDDV